MEHLRTYMSTLKCLFGSSHPDLIYLNLLGIRYSEHVDIDLYFTLWNSLAYGINNLWAPKLWLKEVEQILTFISSYWLFCWDLFTLVTRKKGGSWEWCCSSWQNKKIPSENPTNFFSWFIPVFFSSKYLFLDSPVQSQFFVWQDPKQLKVLIRDSQMSCLQEEPWKASRHG